MAIYHFSAKLISRAAGSSALAAAAYRSASRLHDERLDRDHDFSNKAGVVHSEVMLPDDAPEQLSDRASLWNAVEAAEKRIDAQLAREIEFALPSELDQAEGIRLAREYVKAEFVDRGMIADLNVHWDIGADGLAKPHAHVMLTTRSVGEEGFGPKVRDWNATSLLEHWRVSWGEHVNRRLAELDIDAQVDHRSLQAQGIDLEPQNKIGPAAARMAGQGLSSERLVEHHAIARSNGEKLLANPALALDAITHTQATFTTRDLAKFVHRHSDGQEQFGRVMSAVRAAPELITLGKDGRGEDRFTSRAMIETEQRLERAIDRLADREGHGLAAATQDRAIAAAASEGLLLGGEQQAALRHVVAPRDLASIIGYAGTGKSAMLSVARDGWERAGYHVQGAALSGIAAENLEHGSSIISRTIASLEHQWGQGRELLTSNDVLVIDEAGMIGTRQLERIVSEVHKRGAKLVLVGDPEQLQAIEAGAAFRSIAERHGSVEITQIRRQTEEWQRQATRHLATGRTAEAINAYEQNGRVHAAESRSQARTGLIDCWDRDRTAAPEASRIMLTHTNDEVRELNLAARKRLRIASQLGQDVVIRAERGERSFAAGDRIMFLKNERSLGVKNGSLGTVESISTARMAVLLDDGRAVAFDLKAYAAVDHGYAATVHKAQGVTVDRVHVLATPGLDRHAAYVALSRHRDRVDLHYGEDDFTRRDQLVAALSRERAKDMTSDYQAEFAARRSVQAPALVARRPAQGDMFAGIDLQEQGGRGPARISRDLPSTVGRTVHRQLTPERSHAPSMSGPCGSPALADAVVRHGKIVTAVLFAQDLGEPMTPELRTEVRASRAILNTIVSNGAQDLETAFAVDRPLIREAAEGRPAAAIRSMQLEAELRVDPHRRADVFVERWQSLERQRRLFARDHEDSQVRRTVRTMVGMANGLQRDPQVESILRNRKIELGLPAMPTRSVGQSLADMVGRGRNRGPEIGM